MRRQKSLYLQPENRWYLPDLDRHITTTMKRILLLTALAGTVVGGLLIGCNKEASTGESKGALVSAGKNSFREVTSRLDPGGDLYLYLSTEQLLAGLSGRIAGWREVFASLPNTDAEERDQIGKAFDLVTALVKNSGLEEVSGFGASAIATEPDFYHSKVFLHHYPNRGQGFLWNMCGRKAHALAGLDLLPSNTAMALFSDLDVPLVWSEVQQQARQAGLPQAEEFLNKLPEMFEKSAGLKWGKVLESLGGEFGLVITLDDSRMIPVPLPTREPLEVPEPGVLIVARVKDDVIFNRIETALKQSGQQVIPVDKPDLKMRTLPVPLPLPIRLRPTVAASAGYLFIATTDALIQEALAVKSGQKPGLTSTDEFKRLAKDVSPQGNSFTYLSQRFGRTLMQIQRQALAMSAQAQPAQQQWLQSLLQPERMTFSYCVSANTEEGWLTVGNGNQHPAKMILAPALIFPAAMLSAIAIPNFVKARAASSSNACINNLRQIDAAKQQWALENGKKAADVPTRSDLQPFIGRTPRGPWPVCPQGGQYTIGPVDQLPACSIPGHSLAN
jgi:hypothetical protein